MPGLPECIPVFGTIEPAPVPLLLTAGSLSVDFVQGCVRAVRWNGIEVVRAVECPIRDENWATCATRIVDEKVKSSPDGFELTHERVVADGAMSCRLVFIGDSNGLLRASVELTARRDFRANRAGFTVLHPLDGLAGAPLTVRHPDGTDTAAEFPVLISPDRVAFDIAALVYSIYGVAVNVRFQGEIFEMEDQRNWGDASFKTYCRPVALPAPYLSAAGGTVRQEIQIRMSGRARSVRARANVDAISLELTREHVPEVALALDTLSLPDSSEIQLARLIESRVLQIRLDPDATDAPLACVRDLMGNSNVEIELEAVIPQNREVESYLAHIAERCRHHAISVTRVLALPEAFLRSHQPGGAWPHGLTPREACIIARQLFPGAKVGGGVLTNFAELNRCRPDMSICDYLSHGFTALVHAADDGSVVQSLEGLAHICASARQLAGERHYRLGLVSIGMRSNPYGADVVANPEQIRLAMARIDPRQRGLFAAAWEIGAVAATEGRGVASMALATAVGPFGLIYRRGSWAQPIYDELDGAAVYPLFHAVRALAQMSGGRRLAVRAPHGIVGIGAGRETGCQLILANLQPEMRRLKLPCEAGVRQLDGHSFRDAITNPDWLLDGQASRQHAVKLTPFSVAFIEMPA